MSKRIKIIISVLVLISVVISLLIAFDIFFRDNTDTDSSLDSQLDNSSCDNEIKKYLSFTFPSGQLVKSDFKGEVANISNNLKIFEDLNDDTEAQLIVIRINSNLWIEYTIVGEVLVMMGDSIEEGDILAKVSGEGFEIHDGANIIVWAYDKDNNVITVPLK